MAQQTAPSQDEQASNQRTEDDRKLVWVGFGHMQMKTTVRGPYTTEEAAAKSIAGDDIETESRQIDEDGKTVWFATSRMTEGAFFTDPHSEEMPAVDAVAGKAEAFHVEPRYVTEDPEEETFAKDVHPTY